MKLSICKRCNKEIHSRQKRTYCCKKCYRLDRRHFRCECGRSKTTRNGKCRACRYPRHEDLRRRAVNLYRQGDTCLEVGRILNRSEMTVWKWLKAAGVQMRTPGLRVEKD
jgi:hypothetical protein